MGATPLTDAEKQLLNESIARDDNPDNIRGTIKRARNGYEKPEPPTLRATIEEEEEEWGSEPLSSAGEEPDEEKSYHNLWDSFVANVEGREPTRPFDLLTPMGDYGSHTGIQECNLVVVFCQVGVVVVEQQEFRTYALGPYEFD